MGESNEKIRAASYLLPEPAGEIVRGLIDNCPDCASHKHQTEKLANFIMSSVPGEPSRNEGAIDCAIRLLRENLIKKGFLPNVEDRNV